METTTETTQTETPKRPSNVETRESSSPSLTPSQGWRVKEIEWARAGSLCPERHVASRGSRPASQWSAVFDRIRNALGTGSTFALVGARGTGKTQMAVELAFEVIDRLVGEHVRRYDGLFKPMASYPARYHEALDFFIEIKATYRKSAKRTEREVVAEYAEVPLLVLDEIGVRGETKWEDDLFFSMINKRYAAMKDTILIGNLKPSEVAANVGPSVASRLVETGGIIECAWPSFR